MDEIEWLTQESVVVSDWFNMWDKDMIINY